MYAQIFLGIWMLVNAGFHFFKLKFFLRKSVISILSEDELASYQKGSVLPYILLGILIIVMGIIEGKELLSTPVFIGVYIILASIPFALLFRNNKKHSGYYFW
ncbi:hypothetical protein [Paenibacillus sp. FSL H7-0331]|uniref:hypothetical protein n=1 Tax=Paenibacillus sp. FSL H7-0331 TaxID=1920421 RepID=UPI00096C838E|nr:hypothetical protein [Paenibacillus sp. FSL H7-0331]OMF19319.1 hypothetical protein BK127_04935 [Paenibacillus sp. FSL H7-0331]